MTTAISYPQSRKSSCVTRKVKIMEKFMIGGKEMELTEHEMKHIANVWWEKFGKSGMEKFSGCDRQIIPRVDNCDFSVAASLFDCFCGALDMPQGLVSLITAEIKYLRSFERIVEHAETGLFSFCD